MLQEAEQFGPLSDAVLKWQWRMPGKLENNGKAENFAQTDFLATCMHNPKLIPFWNKVLGIILGNSNGINLNHALCTKF